MQHDCQNKYITPVCVRTIATRPDSNLPQKYSLAAAGFCTWTIDPFMVDCLVLTEDDIIEPTSGRARREMGRVVGLWRQTLSCDT